MLNRKIHNFYGTTNHQEGKETTNRPQGPCPGPNRRKTEELLCDACARLEVAQSSSPHELPEARRDVASGGFL